MTARPDLTNQAGDPAFASSEPRDLAGVNRRLDLNQDFHRGEGGVRPTLVQPQTTKITTSHQCHLCSRSYDRADHLTRHLKTHENARAHKCSQCPKSFNRADLLTRHESNHGRVPSMRRADETTRVLVACRACVASKSKCHEEKPCSRCIQKNLTCEVAPGKQRLGSMSHRTNRHTPPGALSDPSPLELTYGRENGSQSDLHSQSQGMATSPDRNVEERDYRVQEVLSAGVDRNNFVGDIAESFMSFSGPQTDTRPLQQYVPMSSDFTYNQTLGLTPQESYFGQDLDYMIWEMDNAIFEPQVVPENVSRAKQPGESVQDDSGTTVPSTHKQYAAFEKSTWLWNPTTNDHTMNDQANLDIGEEAVALVSTPDTPGTSLDHFSSCCIDSNMRDRILHLLFNCRTGHTSISSFPPLNFLNLIIQLYFVQCRHDSDYMIHSASFNPRTILPELVLAIVSTGASLTTTPAIRKLGLVLQELTRHTVSALWERNNSTTRHLQTLQAWIMSCEIGLWSGIKRKMEIAESLCQPAITIMRRTGVFSIGVAPFDLWPTMDDTPARLNAKWERFIDRESFKRLALRVFIHDVQASVGFQKPPQISFTELAFDPPASEDLWLAQTAYEWRDVYCQKQWTDIPMFHEIIQNAATFQSIGSLIDARASALVIIAGYWGQTWRLIEAKKFYPESRAAYQLSLITEQEELYRALVTTVALMSSRFDGDAIVVLFGQFFLMVSHISLEDVQRFAGKFGPVESKKAVKTFREWSHTSNSRLAIWHGGQVLRAVKGFRPGQLQGFYAVAVYYATLTLWIYGSMISSRGRDPGSTTNGQHNQDDSSTSGNKVYLNEAEAKNLDSFCVSNQGDPGLSMVDSSEVARFKPLTSAADVMEFGRNLLCNNFSSTKEPLPLLVDSLSSLMKELCSSSISHFSEIGVH